MSRPPGEVRVESESDFALSLHAFRFRFRAVDPVHFPAGKAGNVFRGAFGTVFRKVVCTPECSEPKSCAARDQCAYARMFEPALLTGPSGLADPPRPFVFRAAHLDGRTFVAGQRFEIDVHVFDLRDPGLPYLVMTFAQLARDGLGPRRGRVDLESAACVDAHQSASEPLFKRGAFCLNAMPPAPIRLPLGWTGEHIARVHILFVTPTELKSAGAVVSKLNFEILFARVRDRVATLRSLYGAGPLDMDYKGMAARARSVDTVYSDLRSQSVTRLSSRTGQTHGLDGFVGAMEFQGSLGEFLPWLQAAEWCGVGRHTVWGNGQIKVSVSQ